MKPIHYILCLIFLVFVNPLVSLGGITVSTENPEKEKLMASANIETTELKKQKEPLSKSLTQAKDRKRPLQVSIDNLQTKLAQTEKKIKTLGDKANKLMKLDMEKPDTVDFNLIVEAKTAKKIAQKELKAIKKELDKKKSDMKSIDSEVKGIESKIASLDGQISAVDADMKRKIKEMNCGFYEQQYKKLVADIEQKVTVPVSVQADCTHKSVKSEVDCMELGADQAKEIASRQAAPSLVESLKVIGGDYEMVKDQITEKMASFSKVQQVGDPTPVTIKKGLAYHLVALKMKFNVTIFPQLPPGYRDQYMKSKGCGKDTLLSVKPAVPVIKKPVKRKIVKKITKPTLKKTWKDSITGMKFVMIPGGCYTMGDEDETADAPPHKVCVDDFYLGEVEVSQYQWQKIFRGDNPSRKKVMDRPVESVSYDRVQEFIKAFNENSKGKAIVDLPSEAEWEYACRGADNRKYGTKNGSLGKRAANYGVSDILGGINEIDGFNYAAPVNHYPPNSFGLYHMSGNVAEWVKDGYFDNGYKRHKQEDSDPPQNPLVEIGDVEDEDEDEDGDGDEVVVRGGSFLTPKYKLRCNKRDSATVVEKRRDLGFRLKIVEFKE